MIKSEDLFDFQRSLDENILKKYSSTHKVVEHDIYNNKLLALKVEVGELANETKCFKFWSEKQNKVSSKALEELVDCLHFILSIGNDNGYKKFTSFNFKFAQKQFNYRNKLNYKRTDHFQSLLASIEKFEKVRDISCYLDMINDFIIIALDLKFTENQILNAYLDKNKINHERQLQGY